MNRHLFLLLLFLTIAGAAGAEQLEVYGYILDQTGRPLPGANITTASGRGAASDSSGYYHLVVPGRTDTLTISYMGYIPAQEPIIFFPTQTRSRLLVRLKPTVLPGEEVGVIGAREAAEAAVFQIESAKIRRMAAPLPDPMLSLKTLPGVTALNDQTSFYNVRGGNYDENLIYINGFEIQQLHTVRKGYMENPSLVQPLLISAINLRTGAFPVTYGDKLSSVLDISYAPQEEGFSGAVDARTTGATAALAYKKGDKFSIALGARKIYYGYLMRGQHLKGNYQPDYDDVQATLTYKPRPTTSVDFLLIHAQSMFKATPQQLIYATLYDLYVQNYQADFSVNRQEFGFAANVFGARVEQVLNESTKFRLQYSISDQREKEDTDFFYNFSKFRRGGAIDDNQYSQLSSGQEIVKNDLRLSDQNYKVELTHRFESIDLCLGGEAKKFNTTFVRDEFKSAEYDSMADVFFDHYDSDTYRGSVLSFYAHANYALSNRLVAQAGFRWFRANFNKEQVVMPRLSIAYILAPNHTITVSAGRYAQPPIYKEFAFQPMTSDLLAQKSTALTMGYEGQSNGTAIKAEAFYKDMRDLISYDIDDVQLKYSGHNDAVGYIYGADAWLRWQPAKNMVNWISSSFLVAKEDLSNDNFGFIPMPTDRRFQIAFFTEDRMERWENSQVHMRIVYGTGFPFTPYFYRYDEANNQMIIVERARNSGRLSHYTRFDIGFTQEFVLGKKTRITVREEILNLFNHFNVLSIDTTPWNERIKFGMSERVFNVGAMVEF